jgi:hypothetical protein
MINAASSSGGIAAEDRAASIDGVEKHDLAAIVPWFQYGKLAVQPRRTSVYLYR